MTSLSPSHPCEPEDSPRTRVLAAAADVFARSGFAGARVDEIAAVAGVNKAMVYYHVGDKSHIYALVVGERVDRMLAVLRDAIARGTNAEDKLRTAIAAITASASANPHFAPMMLREIASGGAGLPSEVLRKAASVFELFHTILEEGRREGLFRPVDPVSTHMMIAGVVMLLSAGAPIRARLRAAGGSRRATGTENLADNVFDLVIHGLRAGTARPASTQSAKGRKQ